MNNKEGHIATYIPELANIDPEITAIAVKPIGEKIVAYTKGEPSAVTLQSSAKLIPLIGLLEAFGVSQVLK